MFTPRAFALSDAVWPHLPSTPAPVTNPSARWAAHTAATFTSRHGSSAASASTAAGAEPLGVEGVEGVVGVVPPGHLLDPLVPHHTGIGLHAGGAFGLSALAAVAVPGPHLPSWVRPSTFWIAQTKGAFD